MIKVVNPFNKNMEEVYTAANRCGCACSIGSSATNTIQTRELGKLNETINCSCGYGTLNQQANQEMGAKNY